MRLRRLFGAACASLPVLAAFLAGPARAVPDPLLVHCRVFRDDDLSGDRSPDEPLLAGIGITNGRDILVTGADGRVDITVDRSEYRFATLRIPAGYWPTTPWFVRLPSGAAAALDADFGLRPCPESARDVPGIRWIHVADTQVLDPTDRFRLADELVSFGRLAERPLFVVNTGDLVETSPDTTHWNHYATQVARSPLIVFPVVGNHDVLSGATPLAHYERWAGPPYYSFDAGNWHFVVYNAQPNRADAATAAQDAWFAADLAAAPAGSRRVLLQHYMLRESDPAKVEAWAAAGFEACFSGHWHSHQFARRPSGMQDFNISWMRNAGLDRTPRCFGLVTCGADGEIRVEQRRLGVSHRATLVSPAPGQMMGREAVEVLVQAYDTVSRVASLDAHLATASGSRAVPLVRDGISRWRVWIDALSLPPGPADLAVTGSFGDGTPISLTVSFTLADRLPLSRRPVDDWPMFRRCAAGSSYTARALQPPLELAWSAPVPGMVGLSSPVVAAGTVFIGCRAERSADEGGVAAFDAATGSPRWFAPVPSGIALAPAVHGSTLIATSLSDSVYALRTGDGARLWTVPQTDARYTLTAPIVSGETAWVGTEPQVRAVSCGSGAVSWTSARFGDPWYPMIYSAPAASDTRLYYGVFGWPSADTGGFKVLDRATGALVYGEGGCVRSPIWADGTVYTVGASTVADQHLVAREPDGVVRWTATKQLRGGTGSPALAHGVIVVPGTAGAIEAFRASDGANLWTKAVSAELFDMEQGWGAVRATPGTPAIADHVVWIGSLDGNLYAIDLDTGAERFRFPLGTPIASSPAISGNMLFVAAEDEHLYAFAVAGGKLRVGSRVNHRDPGLALGLPHPNPTTGSAAIEWAMPTPGLATVRVYGVDGTLVRTLVQRHLAAGRQAVTWDGTDRLGRRVGSGTWWVRVEACGETAERKLVLLR